MHLLLVPPDTRPPTLAFPKTLAEAAGCTVSIPPPAALPNLNTPGDPGVLADWLMTHAPHADLLIVSLETLCLGGMIPARRVNDSLEATLERLKLLSRLKTNAPHLRILAGGVVVRVAHDNDPFEEKPYYAQHGGALRAYSEAYDRYARYGSREDERRLQRAVGALPQSILEDYLATRKRNHQLHLAALKLCQQRVIEHLCLTLDDTSEYGLAAHDRRALEDTTDRHALWPHVDIYPGADEVPLTLLARALQTEPTKVTVRYSGSLGAAAGLIYEDRPAGELVKAQLRAAGCIQVESLAEADLVLAVNTPAVRQASRQPDVATVDTAARHLPEFADFIARTLPGKPLALADIAYPNGAENRLLTLLKPRLRLSKLNGYSAWNTAGNTLGSAIAMGVLSSRVQQPQRWLEALFGRLVDDALYQGEVRAQVAQTLTSPDPYDLGTHRAEAEARLAERITPLALTLWDEHFAAQGVRLEWGHPHLAWPRLFTGVFPFNVVTEGDG